MLCMVNISSSTYFEIASCTRVAILNIVTFYCDGVGLLTSASFAEQDSYVSSLLSTMASNRTL